MNEHRVQLKAALGLIVIGAGLLIAGFMVSPTGEVHNSVLVAFGEILTFAGSIFGIDYKYRVNIKDTDKNEKDNQDNSPLHGDS